MNLDVYDPTNTTLVGTLSQPHGIQWLDDLLVPGSATFQVDTAVSADTALIVPRRVVRFREGSTDLWAGVIRDLPADIQDEPGSENVSTVRVECDGLLAWLGYRHGGAVMWPLGGMEGRQQNPRLFGWMTEDFDDSGMEWVPFPTGTGPLSTEGWPDPDARAFTAPNPEAGALYRRFLPALDEPESAARMYLAATWETSVTIWLDGDVVLEKPAGSPGLWTADVPYDDIDHQIAVEVQGGVGRWGWTWMRLEEDTDEDGNEVWSAGTVLRRTFTFEDFPDAQTPWLEFDLDGEEYPGVTVGFVLDTALTEDGARHSRPWSWSFDGDAGSDTVAWDKVFTRGFRVQEVGRLVDELSSIEGEPEMQPDGTFRFVTSRGADKTGSVTVSSPFDLSLTGRGPTATRWLYETEGGFGTAINAAAETEWGTVMERFVQLGTDISPDAIADAVADELVREGRLLDEVQVDVNGVTPYDDVVLGDTVTCVGRDGTAPVRLTSFIGRVDDATGAIEWTVTGEPVGSA